MQASRICMITKRHTLSSQRLPGPLSEFAARNGVDVSKVVVEFRILA